MRRSTLLLVLAFGLVALLVAYGRRVPRPPPADWRAELAARTKAAGQQPSMTTFMVPGPNGASMRVAFYGLDRLPQVTDEAFCKRLSEYREARPTLPETATDADARKEKAETAEVARTALGVACDTTRLAAERFEAAGNVRVLVGSDGERAIYADLTVAGALARLNVAAMREARTWQEVLRSASNRFEFRMVEDGVSGLWFRRLAADLDRVTGALCGPASDLDCAPTLLVAAARTYAELGRQTNDEQHFQDAGDVLRQAEAMLKPLKDAPENLHLFRTIASAYGYAGEAGRNEAFVRKATEISGDVVAALEPGKDGVNIHDYSNAVATFGANLGRLAGYDTDKRGVLERAIAANVLGIAHDERHDPDFPSWSNHVNLSTSAIELYAITREDRVIDDAVAHGHRAVGIVGRKVEAKTADELDLAYVRMRLGEALAWKARHGQALEETARRALAEEARTLLDQAEPVFSASNAQAYLRSLRRNRPLVEQVLKVPEP
jgi:hypothetical protein